MNVQEFYSLYQQCGKVTIDSRKIEPKDIFFAFSGENFNAATLAEQAIEKGALAAIVEQKEYENLDKNIFYTPSTLTFLQELSQFHRQQLKIPIIGLTGSNGKTTTKELISAVLSQKYKVQFTFGNLNNHIGVPLTLLSIKPEHDIAVVEMGANHQKEIQELCELAQPNIGYITNFGKAHLEGFGGFEGVIKGKSELYDYLKQNHQTILLNLNDDLQKERVGHYAPVISFGTPDADYYFEQLAEDNFVGLGFKGEVAQSHLTGNYNFTNLCAAASLGFHFGLSFQQIKHAIEGYTPTNMRSQVMVKDGKTLVLDTYNANPSSMAASLQNFKSFEGSKTVIMGDMLELGEESLAEHRAILALAQSLNFETIITVGKEFAEVTNNNFKTTTELIDYLQKHSIDTQSILLKGSRGIALEKIIEYL
ncbi:UDP-N-acetylmuramoyl-tripeptide--D-alanyl-D-alanine ligase [Bergeyella porcorum]|uniref:UDP-N-acetylmuramoyl-tripeptide--D-alanyl-D- alanine ligase n=1 Tax=Bergeyella porcorum TaxID=1735111 RepID=UPI0035E5C1B0